MLAKILLGTPNITCFHKRPENASLNVFVPLETAIKFTIRSAVPRCHRIAVIDYRRKWLQLH